VWFCASTPVFYSPPPRALPDLSRLGDTRARKFRARDLVAAGEGSGLPPGGGAENWRLLLALGVPLDRRPPGAECPMPLALDLPRLNSRAALVRMRDAMLVAPPRRPVPPRAGVIGGGDMRPTGDGVAGAGADAGASAGADAGAGAGAGTGPVLSASEGRGGEGAAVLIRPVTLFSLPPFDSAPPVRDSCNPNRDRSPSRSVLPLLS
jgi:hypothetical protein